jgi:hypothetical protein
MKTWSISGSGLSTFLAFGLLAGCGGSVGIGAPEPSNNGASAMSPLSGKTFLFTGKAQSFTVPAGVGSITVVARGAAGTPNYACSRTGLGGRVFAVIPVTPHQRLTVYVGGGGSANGTAGGFNGGGVGGRGGGAGGGASDVRLSPGRLHDRILVAGGGGGIGGGGNYDFSGCGGGGGGLTGDTGGAGLGYSPFSAGGGGAGGTQTSGGAAGPGGKGAPSHSCLHNGYPGRDGNRDGGGAGGKPSSKGGGSANSGGGGGGGGYFGGGGGGSGCGSRDVTNTGGGGGGGSSYAEPSAMRVRTWPNWKNATGNGLVVFSW